MLGSSLPEVKVAFKISQNSQGNTCAGVSFLRKLQDACEFSEFFTGNFFVGHLRTAPLNFLYTLFSLLATLFFNSASMLLNFFMNWASNVVWVFLNTYNHHYTETHFIFSIFVSICRPRSIYAVSMWSLFHFQHLFHCY